MDDLVFWESTPKEVHLLLREIVEEKTRESRAASLRAGLVAAAIYNVHRKPGARALRAEDFIREPPKLLTASQMEVQMDAWMASVNRGEPA